ncbi:hypothetical protein MP228_002795 [Amoeboaphelidium protococcarum]|nr:hypothetical protein MP228_002795 [Amoeboaphelidium protococcarum]
MSKKDKVSKMLIKLRVPAQMATPSPPIGPALGSKGLKAIDFVKKFNDLTSGRVAAEPNMGNIKFESGVPVRVHLRVNPDDKSYSMYLGTPSTTHMLKRAVASIYMNQSGQAAGVDFKTVLNAVKGAKQPLHTKPFIDLDGVSNANDEGEDQQSELYVTLKHVYEIAKIKQQDQVNKDVKLQSLCKSIISTAKSMGLKVVP